MRMKMKHSSRRSEKLADFVLQLVSQVSRAHNQLRHFANPLHCIGGRHGGVAVGVLHVGDVVAERHRREILSDGGRSHTPYRLQQVVFSETSTGAHRLQLPAQTLHIPNMHKRIITNLRHSDIVTKQFVIRDTTRNTSLLLMIHNGNSPLSNLVIDKSEF